MPCPNVIKCFKENTTCEKFEREITKVKKRLPLETKMEIYNKYMSGQYYISELLREYHISDNTFKRLVNEINELKHKILQTD